MSPSIADVCATLRLHVSRDFVCCRVDMAGSYAYFSHWLLPSSLTAIFSANAKSHNDYLMLYFPIVLQTPPNWITTTVQCTFEHHSLVAAIFHSITKYMTVSGSLFLVRVTGTKTVCCLAEQNCWLKISLLFPHATSGMLVDGVCNFPLFSATSVCISSFWLFTVIVVVAVIGPNHLDRFSLSPHRRGGYRPVVICFANFALPHDTFAACISSAHAMGWAVCESWMKHTVMLCTKSACSAAASESRGNRLILRAICVVLVKMFHSYVWMNES